MSGCEALRVEVQAARFGLRSATAKNGSALLGLLRPPARLGDPSPGAARRLPRTPRALRPTRSPYHEICCWHAWQRGHS
jgi:hypothetical protein